MGADSVGSTENSDMASVRKKSQEISEPLCVTAEEVTCDKRVTGMQQFEAWGLSEVGQPRMSLCRCEIRTQCIRVRGSQGMGPTGLDRMMLSTGKGAAGASFEKSTL